MEKLRKRRSTEGVGEPDVYDSVRGFAFFKLAFAIRILWRPRKHMTLGVRFFSSAARSSRHTNRNTRLWMVCWGKKKRARRNGRQLPIEWCAWSCVWEPLWSVDPRKKVTMTKHEKRTASKLCAWFNYKKKSAMHKFFWKAWFWEATGFRASFGRSEPTFSRWRAADNDWYAMIHARNRS